MIHFGGYNCAIYHKQPILWAITQVSHKSLKFLSEKCQNVPQIFLNMSKNPLSRIFDSFKNKPILPKFFPARAEKNARDCLHLHGCKVSSGKLLNWITSSIECQNWVFCQENRVKTRKQTKKGYGFFQISQNFPNISETSKYLKKYPDICVKA